MTWTGWFSSSQAAAKLFPNGFCKINTSINQSLTTEVNTRDNLFMFKTTQTKVYAPTGTWIYLQANESATEPAGDKLLDTNTWTGTIYNFSVSGDPPGYIISFTSDTGFFTSNQDFSTHNTSWTIYYRSYYTDTLPEGETAICEMEFYKRNTDDEDTLLFSQKNGISAFTNEGNTTVTPSGSVTTDDRLRIRIKIYSEVPT